MKKYKITKIMDDINPIKSPVPRLNRKSIENKIQKNIAEIIATFEAFRNTISKDLLSIIFKIINNKKNALDIMPKSKVAPKLIEGDKYINTKNMQNKKILKKLFIVSVPFIFY